MLCVSAIWAACGPGGSVTKPEANLASELGADEGKADMVKKTKLVKDLALDSTVVGTFDRKIRVYGYVLEAKKGAKLTVKLEAKAGSDASGIAAGQDLDTIISVNGPYQSQTSPGPTITESDDNGDSVVPTPLVKRVACSTSRTTTGSTSPTRS
jgi:hypothetical protein